MNSGRININKWTRKRWIVKDRIFFAGGYPKFYIIPKFVKWYPYLSIFWLGTELVIRFKKKLKLKTYFRVKTLTK